MEREEGEMKGEMERWRDAGRRKRNRHQENDLKMEQ